MKSERSKRIAPPFWVRLIRWLSLIFAVGLILLLPTPSESPLPPDLLFRIDPLLALSVFLSQWVVPPFLIFALVAFASTLFVGRAFCGYFCPLGVWLDICGVRKGSNRNKFMPLKLRYMILLGLLIAVLLGLPLVYLLDPIGIFYRCLILAVVPLGGKTLAAASYQFDSWGMLPAATDGFLGWLNTLSQSPSGIRFYALGFVSVIFFLSITLLERLAPRFWCRYLCPLGAMLSLPSRLSILQRKVDHDTCNNCLVCKSTCPMNAISDDGLSTDMSLCLNCKQCKLACPNNGIRFRLNLPQPASASRVDLGRRAALGSMATALLGAAAVRLSFDSFSRVDIIRPPGALPEDMFLGRCVGCMQCAQICPTNIIVPTDTRRGMAALYTPRLDFARQGCAQDCVLCMQVCPTGALYKFSLEEKSYLKLGTAVVNRGGCLSWSQSQLCLVCKESCPYGAIAARFVQGVKGDVLVPVVYRSRCVGCGTCEANCPVRGRSAITIQSDGEDRASGKFPPIDKIYEIRGRRRGRPVKDDPPPGIGS